MAAGELPGESEVDPIDVWPGLDVLLALLVVGGSSEGGDDGHEVGVGFLESCDHGDLLGPGILLIGADDDGCGVDDGRQDVGALSTQLPGVVLVGEEEGVFVGVDGVGRAGVVVVFDCMDLKAGLDGDHGLGAALGVDAPDDVADVVQHLVDGGVGPHAAFGRGDAVVDEADADLAFATTSGRFHEDTNDDGVVVLLLDLDDPEAVGSIVAGVVTAQGDLALSATDPWLRLAQ